MTTTTSTTPTTSPTGASHAGRVVVGVDGSVGSLAALRWAARQAEVTGSSLVAVTTWEVPVAAYGPVLLPVDMDLPGSAQRVLDETLRATFDGPPPVPVEPRVIEGPPALALVHAAEGADLLVVGTRGHGAFVGMLLGSVSEHCVTHAHCPVVVVPHEH